MRRQDILHELAVAGCRRSLNSGPQVFSIKVERQAMATKRTGVLVLGMHHSGYPAMAEMLGMLGCARPATPDGAAVESFDDRILNEIGTSWQDWLPVNPGWYGSPPYGGQVARGAQLVATEFSGSPLFVLSDPRMGRLSRFWLDVLAAGEIDPAIVLLVRNPIEVARALREEDGTDMGFGLLLWLRNVLEAEAATRGRRRVTCSHAQLVDQWEALAVRISGALGLSWPRYSPQVRAEIARSFEQRPRQPLSSDDAVAVDPSLSDWVRKTFAILTRWADQGEADRDHAALDAIRQEFDAVSPAFSDWIVAASRIAGERTALQARVQREEGLVEERKRLERSLQEANGQATALGAEVAQLRHRLAETESRLRQTQEEIAQAWSQLNEERDRAGTVTEEIEARHARLRDKLADSEAWVFRLSADRARAEGEVVRIQSRLAAVERERDTARAQVMEIMGHKTRLEQRLKDRQEGQMARDAAELADLRKSLQKNAQQLQAAEARAGGLLATKDDAEKRLRGRHEELAAITKLLRESENAELRQKDDADWLLAVSTIFVTRPGWWFVLPPALRRRNLHRLVKLKGLFDAQSYLARYPDVARSKTDPLRHYIKHGMRENRINDARLETARLADAGHAVY
ncbi:hypothetical protein DMC47_43705 [Nostoc sp. 3335mG]|nr:hypothetical protein DMC47_43705 [Nostoc sp. 3335mG]